MRFLIVMLIVFSAILAATFIVPADAATCMSQATVTEKASIEYPEAIISRLNQKQSADYIVEFNALPPATDLPPPNAMMIISADQLTPNVLVLGFRGGCRIGHLLIGTKKHQVILRKILGREV